MLIFCKVKRTHDFFNENLHLYFVIPFLYKMCFLPTTLVSLFLFYLKLLIQYHMFRVLNLYFILLEISYCRSTVKTKKKRPIIQNFPVIAHKSVIHSFLIAIPSDFLMQWSLQTSQLRAL